MGLLNMVEIKDVDAAYAEITHRIGRFKTIDHRVTKGEFLGTDNVGAKFYSLFITDPRNVTKARKDINVISSKRNLHVAATTNDKRLVFDGQEGFMVSSEGFRNDPAKYMKLTGGEEAALDAIQAAKKPEDISQPAKQLLESLNGRVSR